MILITTQTFPPDRGGMETLMGGLADALHRSGEKISVFADRVHTPGVDELDLPYPMRRFASVRPVRRRTKAMAIAEAAQGRLVKGLFADSWKSIELLPRLGAPCAVLAHGMEFPTRPSEHKRMRIARSLSKARTVIANSRYTASLVRPYLSDGERRLVVINPPIGRQPDPTPQAIGKLRRIADGRGPVLLTLARLEPRKGVDMVIRAMRNVRKAYPDALYVVAGDGEDRKRLEQLAEDNGVAASVRFVGAVDLDFKAALLASSDVFAMPTRREGDSVEGFGLAYIEAGWHSVPALAGREGGATDAVLDEETGLTCNASSLADVTSKLMRLIDDGALRKRLGAAAAKRAHGPLQWSESLPRYLAALGLELVASRAR